jgi:hypothetical protein
VSGTPGASVKFGPREPDPVIRVVCRGAKHAASKTLAELKREDCWDGSGRHYWVRLSRMTNKERALWEQSEPAPGAPMPGDYRDARPGVGFAWLRHGEPVSVSEGYAIGQAYHHGSRSARTGTPEPGILDGVTRVFELPSCQCGAPGVPTVPGDVVERVLDEIHARGLEAVPLATFRAALIATR